MPVLLDVAVSPFEIAGLIILPILLLLLLLAAVTAGVIVLVVVLNKKKKKAETPSVPAEAANEADPVPAEDDTVKENE